ncbi:purine permease [Coprinopsis sp. MPI-PUGE-AT-0042]|nr:purine permease [Coprinopsis sp. MPI-PUGE-AT-0042]
MANVDSQPQPVAEPETSAPSKLSGVQAAVGRIKRRATTKEGWVGDYDYSCFPSRRGRGGYHPFYALEDELPLLLGITSGLQHALAMLAGLITPPIILASALSLDAALSSYMISASLIAVVSTLVQMSRYTSSKSYYIGTGLLTVVGTSFATLSTANARSFINIARCLIMRCIVDGTCPSTINADGTQPEGPCPDAYGKILGTVRTVILMIGASLIGESGIATGEVDPTTASSDLKPDSSRSVPTLLLLDPFPGDPPNSSVSGFSRLALSSSLKCLGSPFMRNISIICGLVVGCIVAGATGYMSISSIDSAPAITFLWVHRFKLGVYPPAILPMVSKQPVVGDVFDSRIQGGVLGDGIAGVMVGPLHVTPLSTFAQNNGVIAITRCANRGAGRWCCFFLILFGVLGKLSGVFLAIPNPVLGGVNTFLFANVVTSGLRVYLPYRLDVGKGLSSQPPCTRLLRSSLKGCRHPMRVYVACSTRSTIILSTPFLSAGLVATILNLVLPTDAEEKEAPISDDTSSDVHQIDVEGQRYEKDEKEFLRGSSWDSDPTSRQGVLTNENLGSSMSVKSLEGCEVKCNRLWECSMRFSMNP